MEDKMFEFLKILHEDINNIKEDINDIKEDVNNIKSDINSIKVEVKNLQEGQIRIETKIDTLDNKVSELEPLNAKRHIEINNKIEKLSMDINVVEAISGKNLTDIAILKAVK